MFDYGLAGGQSRFSLRWYYRYTSIRHLKEPALAILAGRGGGGAKYSKNRIRLSVCISCGIYLMFPTCYSRMDLGVPQSREVMSPSKISIAFFWKFLMFSWLENKMIKCYSNTIALHTFGYTSFHRETVKSIIADLRSRFWNLCVICLYAKLSVAIIARSRGHTTGASYY